MRALCVGNGPSLKSYGDHEWALMRAYYDLIVVVNRYYLRPIPHLNPDWLACVDINAVREYQAEFQHFLHSTPTGVILNNDVVDYLGLDWFKAQAHRCLCVWLGHDRADHYGDYWPTKLERVMHMPSPRNVMLFAIPMAVMLGATSVDLIGVDMTKHHLHYYDTRETLTNNGRMQKYEINHPDDPLTWHPEMDSLVQGNYRKLKAWMDGLSVPLRNLTRSGNRILALQDAELHGHHLCTSGPPVPEGQPQNEAAPGEEEGPVAEGSSASPPAPVPVHLPRREQA